MTSAGGLVPVGRGRRAARRRCCCRARPAACGPAPRSPPPAGSPTRSPSTWAAPAPTCASCSTACPSRRPSARSPASRSGCRRSTSTPSAPAAGRSPASTRAARSWSGPTSAGAVPGPGLLRPRRHRADGHRRRPRRRAHPRRRRASPASAGSTSTRRAPALDRRRRRPPTGVVAVVDAAMEQALRAVTVERGVDPRGLALVAFGGAGPLHACALADALGMAAVIVPPRAGVLSAVGLLCRAARSASWCGRGRRRVDHAGLDEARCGAGATSVGRAGSVDGGGRGRDGRSTAATRARATSSPWPTVDDFPAEHERRNGYDRAGRRRSRSSRSGRRAPARSPVDRRRTLPARRPRDPSCRPGGRRRARLHDLGPRRLARRAGRRRRAWCSTSGARSMTRSTRRRSRC